MRIHWPDRAATTISMMNSSIDMPPKPSSGPVSDNVSPPRLGRLVLLGGADPPCRGC